LCSSSNLSQRKKPCDADSATSTDEHHSKDESSPTLSFRIRDFNTRTLAQALHSLVRVSRRVNGIRLYAKIPAVPIDIKVLSGIIPKQSHTYLHQALLKAQTSTLTYSCCVTHNTCMHTRRQDRPEDHKFKSFLMHTRASVTRTCEPTNPVA
jgi:hypothetical protein